jgi:hypothetical protein
MLSLHRGHRAAGTALALALALLLGGCGDDDPAPGSGDGGWTATEDPVDRSGLVWAADGVVHLGDGSTIDTGSDLEGYVVAGDGVYFVKATDDGGSGKIFHATPDGVDATGAYADARSLKPSADGRYLGFIDMTTGQEDGFGTPVATAVVVDLDQGKEVVRSTDGMGDPDGDDDLLDLYEDSDAPFVFGVTDDTAYIGTTDGAFAYDLASGEGTQVADTTTDARDQDWYHQLNPDRATNPSGTWSILNRYDGRPPLLVPDHGKPVAGDAPFDVWGLDSWLDDSTAVGSAAPAEEGGTGVVLLTCVVPSGACTTVPGTEDGVLIPEDRRQAGA